MKILIIDDHTLFREGLSLVLDQLEGENEILEADNYSQAKDHLSTNPDIDLVLQDLYFPGNNGFEVLIEINQQYPALPVVIISASKKPSDIQQALNSGAVGYITKDTSSDVMFKALQLILAGGIYVPQAILKTAHSPQETENSVIDNLTPRQQEVLSYIGDGFSNQEIGEKLKLSESTVKMHITSIFKGLSVNNRTQAAKIANQSNMTE